MGKIIRPTYPIEVSVGILLLIFSISFFLSHQIFDIHAMPKDESVYLGMFLVSTAVLIMVLVLWEEFLFPIKIKPSENGVIFRNHRSKLRKQLLIYCAIPTIFGFIYFRYEVNHVRFFVWLAVCTIAPLAGKLISGVKNYNDFLRLTRDQIEYKNNEKTGVFNVNDISEITLLKDDRKVLHKIRLLHNGNEVMIDLDEMELEAFLNSIDKFITAQYKTLLKGMDGTSPSAVQQPRTV